MRSLRAEVVPIAQQEPQSKRKSKKYYQRHNQVTKVFIFDQMKVNIEGGRKVGGREGEVEGERGRGREEGQRERERV